MENIIVKVDRKKRIATITLNFQPLNIVDDKVYEQIIEAFTNINSVEGIGVVILNSACRHFCAGGDLEWIQNCSTQEALDIVCQTAGGCMSSIYNCKYPVIASVNGLAIGAGAAMAACADLTIATDDAAFSVPEATVGFIGASEFLEMVIPRRLARYYIYTGDRISAQEMRHWGAVFDVVSRDRLAERTMEVAEHIAAQSPLALSYSKAAMNHNDDERLLEKYEHEAQYTLLYNPTEDCKETYSAFKEHRKPVFTGK